MSASPSSTVLLAALDAFTPGCAAEAADVARIRELARAGDPWPRGLPLHVTGSVLIVDPVRKQVLLRWHARQQAWLQVGGHGDPGEQDPIAVAFREGREETGLADLRPFPGPAPAVLQVCIMPVAAGKGEPEHEHADIRYCLATSTPHAARPETKGAPVEWLSLDEALARAADENLQVGLRRVRALLET
ncbi:MAG: NUDIX hydrolase [Chloroflexota bacterium]